MLPSLLFSLYCLRHSAASDMLTAVNVEQPCRFHWDLARVEGPQLIKDDAVVPTRVELLDQQMKRWSLQRYAEALALSPEAGSDQRIYAGASGGLYQPWVRLSHRGEVWDEAIAVQPYEDAMRSGLQGAFPKCPCDGRVSLRGCEQARWESEDLAVSFVQEDERRRNSPSLCEFLLQRTHQFVCALQECIRFHKPPIELKSGRSWPELGRISQRRESRNTGQSIRRNGDLNHLHAEIHFGVTCTE